MKRFAVVRVCYNRYPPRMAKEISGFGKVGQNIWHYYIRDVDNKDSHDGFVEVFEREDAARRSFEASKGMDGYVSWYTLVYVRSLTKSGAAKQAIRSAVGMLNTSGELLDSYLHEKPE
jgi:hypothetical protein